MKQKEIRKDLENGLQTLVNRHPWLTVKYEYSFNRHVYVVSYCIDNQECADDSFWNDSMGLEDKLSMAYGDDAPLFCDNERLFHLNMKAHVIRKQEINYFHTPIYS